MLDFTSALYLGLRHGSGSLAPWRSLTTGVPAALGEPAASADVGRRLARLTGCEAAVLGTSTLHLVSDLLALLARRRAAIFADAGLYPVARWGIERAAGRGVPVATFRHHHAGDLEVRLAAGRSAAARQRGGWGSGGGRGRLPVVVCDGFCPGCGQAAPLGAYLDAVRRRGGLLVVDDTQALGVQGASPGPGTPSGEGGGGSLRRLRIGGPEVVLVSSLAKGLGAPLAVLGGSADLVRRFRRESETRVHSSPPSVAAIHAAARALAINRARGDALRRRLSGLISRFRCGLASIGLATVGEFPVQTLVIRHGPATAELFRRLLRRGVRTVLHRSRCQPGVGLAFIVTARHRRHEIDAAIDRLRDLVGPPRQDPWRTAPTGNSKPILAGAER